MKWYQALLMQAIDVEQKQMKSISQRNIQYVVTLNLKFCDVCQNNILNNSRPSKFRVNLSAKKFNYERWMSKQGSTIHHAFNINSETGKEMV